MTGEENAAAGEIILRPSLPRSLFYAATSAAIGVIFIFLAQTGEASPLPAYLATFVLTAGAAVLLAAHFPGASYLKLHDDGFEIRELFKSRHYRWLEVSNFISKRKLLGTAIEFAHFDPETGVPSGHTVPSGYTMPSDRLIDLMNDRRDSVIKAQDA